MTPSRIGRYEVQRRLGRGGMGSLYLGYDPKLKRSVAIKLLNEDIRDNRELRERFAREAESVARLRHPNIVVVFDVGEDEGGQPFMAMEYIAGETLKRILEPPSIPLHRRLALIEDLCAGLAHAHAAGIVHRDIKPDNVMLDADGVLKILDFGIARHANSGMTQDGMMLGSFNYMSPEQMVGRVVDHRSDIFAVGAVLYEVVALQRAFPGTFPEAYHRILNAGPVPLQERVPGVDPELARIVNRALETDPERRYQHVNALRQELTQVRRRLGQLHDSVSDQTTHAGTQVARPKTERTDPRRPTDNKRFAEIRRQQVEEHLRLGQAAFEQGEHDAALQHAERAASVDPDNRVAFELIDSARLAIDTKVVLKLLREATRLVTEGRLDEASEVCRQASATVPDLPGADGLREEVRYVLDAIRTAREREARIDASLQRARELLDKGSYDTALRAVYEVLALDTDHDEARDLERRAKEQLDAQRERERVTRQAYERLKSARDLAHDGRFDEALSTIGAVTPPSGTVRQAISEALAEVKGLQHRAAVRAAVTAAADALAQGKPEVALAGIDAIAAVDQTDESRAVRAAAARQIDEQRELARKKQVLEEAIAAAGVLVGQGHVDQAQARVDEAAATGIADERLDVLRRRIAELRAAAEAKRREEARVRLASGRVEAARRLFAGGDLNAAIALLEDDDTGHEIVGTALRELRADRDERLRREAERQRQEEEARKRAEREAAQRLEEQRRADERKRLEAEAAQRARAEAERKARTEAEQKAFAEAERKARDEAERKARAEVERKAREEAEQKARVEAEHKARAEAERKAREEAERKARAEAERKSRQEAEQKARAEAERKARAEAELRAENARRLEEARRQEEARLQEAARQEEARRHEEEQAEKQEAVTQILTQVRATPAHQEALDLLQDARRLVPDDPEVQTLIQERRAALVVPPETRAPAPAVPRLDPAARVISKAHLTAAGVVVAVIGLGVGAFYFRGAPNPVVEERPTTPTLPLPRPGVTSTVPGSPPLPGPLNQGTIRVDALPWATVRIRPLSDGIQLATSEYTTPFSLQLPHGDYELRFSNPQYKAPEAARVKVTDKPVDLRVTMGGFDPEKALDAILDQR